METEITPIKMEDGTPIAFGDIVEVRERGYSDYNGVVREGRVVQLYPDTYDDGIRRFLVKFQIDRGYSSTRNTQLHDVIRNITHEQKRMEKNMATVEGL